MSSAVETTLNFIMRHPIMNDRAPSYQWKSLKETNRFTSSPFILHPFFRNCLHLNPFSRHYYTIILAIAVMSPVGSRGSSFQPCIVPRRIKGFALRLVSWFRVSGFKPLRTLCSLRLKNSPTPDIVLQTIPNIQCTPCIRDRVSRQLVAALRNSTRRR